MLARISASPTVSGAVTVSTNLGSGPIAATRVRSDAPLAAGRQGRKRGQSREHQAAAEVDGPPCGLGLALKRGSSTTGYSNPTVLLN